MNVTDVLRQAAAILNLNVDLTANAPSREVRALVTCAEIVYTELISDYFPLITEENMRFDGQGRVAISVFNKRLLRIMSVKRSLANFRYTVFPEFIEAAGGSNLNLTVRYAYEPENSPAIGGQVELPAGATERIFALGIAAEYCLMHGMYNESVMYDKRYKDALQIAVRKRGEMRMPSRRWMR